MWREMMQKFVRFIDPKLEKYRKKHPVPAPRQPEAPKSLDDFIKVIQRTPKSVLSATDRARIAAVMSFGERTVGDLMVSRSKMVFVGEHEFLGPLTLDKLYKSGFTNFPVVDDKDHVKGVIHTEALNALAIKKTDRAEKYLDKHFEYLRATDTLDHAVSEIIRTNAYYFLVLDPSGTLVGFFTTQLLLDYLLGN